MPISTDINQYMYMATSYMQCTYCFVMITCSMDSRRWSLRVLVDITCNCKLHCTELILVGVLHMCLHQGLLHLATPDETSLFSICTFQPSQSYNAEKLYFITAPKSNEGKNFHCISQFQGLLRSISAESVLYSRPTFKWLFVRMSTTAPRIASHSPLVPRRQKTLHTVQLCNR